MDDRWVFRGMAFVIGGVGVLEGSVAYMMDSWSRFLLGLFLVALSQYVSEVNGDHGAP
jgi:hypothetical protein